MNNKKFTEPVLQQIRDWIEAGHTADDIARRLDTSLNCLHVICSCAGISLRRRQHSSIAVRFDLPAKTHVRVSNYAEQSGRSVDMLIRELLMHVARDDLFRAVLDEEEVIPRVHESAVA